MRLAVTIDTEADGQWSHGVPLTTRNVGFWAPFQDLCERHGVAPTYLLASEIIEDERARELLGEWSRRGAAELGTHLHPWTTAPFLDRDGLRHNDVVHAFPCQLPDGLLREKLGVLTGQFVAAFGRRPTSHRAGRFGVDGRCAAYLADDGYIVDSSVCPQWSWRAQPGLDGRGGPDFRAHTVHPFAVTGTGEPGLVEIPVTILPTYGPLRRSPRLLRAYQLLPVRAVRRLLLSRWLQPQPMWLTPDPRLSVNDLAALWSCAAAVGIDSVVMMFHSSELMPGGSPFRPDERSVRDLLQCLEAFFDFVVREGGEFAMLTPMARDLAAGDGLRAQPI